MVRLPQILGFGFSVQKDLQTAVFLSQAVLQMLNGVVGNVCPGPVHLGRRRRSGLLWLTLPRSCLYRENAVVVGVRCRNVRISVSGEDRLGGLLHVPGVSKSFMALLAAGAAGARCSRLVTPL